MGRFESTGSQNAGLITPLAPQKREQGTAQKEKRNSLFRRGCRDWMPLKFCFCKSLLLRTIRKTPTPLTELKRLACGLKLSFACTQAKHHRSKQKQTKENHIMKKVTLSALAAIAVAGTSFAGPTEVVSKDFKQPCVTPCFRDQEFQLDLFYSFNDAEHQGNASATDTFLATPGTTPLATGVLDRANPLLTTPASFSGIPAGSEVIRSQRATVNLPPYFKDGSGGGVGVNYFFAKYFGIGVEGNWWDGTRDGFGGTLNTSDGVIVAAPGVDATTLAAAIKSTNSTVTVLSNGNLIIKDRRAFGNTSSKVGNQVTGNLILRYPFEGPICWAPYIFGGGGGVFANEDTGFGDIGVGVEFRITPNMGFFTDWRWEFMSGNNGNGDYRSNSLIRDLNKTYGLNNLKVIDANSRNDVNMTRVGIRFAF
jgi:hypothetical protein